MNGGTKRMGGGGEVSAGVRWRARWGPCLVVPALASEGLWVDCGMSARRDTLCLPVVQLPSPSRPARPRPCAASARKQRQDAPCYHNSGAVVPW